MTQEKNISDSSKPNTGDNNNNVAKRSYRPPQKGIISLYPAGVPAMTRSSTCNQTKLGHTFCWHRDISSPAAAAPRGDRGSHSGRAGGPRRLCGRWRLEPCGRCSAHGSLGQELLPVEAGGWPACWEGWGGRGGPQLCRLQPGLEWWRGGVGAGPGWRQGFPLVSGRQPRLHLVASRGSSEQPQSERTGQSPSHPVWGRLQCRQSVPAGGRHAGGEARLPAVQAKIKFTAFYPCKLIGSSVLSCLSGRVGVWSRQHDVCSSNIGIIYLLSLMILQNCRSANNCWGSTAPTY